MARPYFAASVQFPVFSEEVISLNGTFSAQCLTHQRDPQKSQTRAHTHTHTRTHPRLPLCYTVLGAVALKL